MRTTLDVDIDVLRAAKELAKRKKKSTGQVVSELVRTALTAPPPPATAAEPDSTYGFRPFAKRGGLVTNEMIDRLREDDAY